ncbi:hypothetical protein E4T38_09917 [Aureobasidium subglaciale]|nr:hypothetical protein E4T38_09917 [Aureobasidium subglaciale]KAI5214345.1 hypothetical protein E4T41_09930 [Aureobasidium subglaciale]KAI5215434.1 hypothetical protein E4T40_08438 [Aureobasidium subglaciale]KAI5252492.1 hypothetical protein E4T46_09917 [Aureobasidium subglaciale]
MTGQTRFPPSERNGALSTDHTVVISVACYQDGVAVPYYQESCFLSSFQDARADCKVPSFAILAAHLREMPRSIGIITETVLLWRTPNDRYRRVDDDATFLAALMDTLFTSSSTVELLIVEGLGMINSFEMQDKSSSDSTSEDV